MKIAGLLLAVLVLILSVLFGRSSHADGVCGDGAIDSPEQCDDGNLSNGDGCSNVCKIEVCGNGTVDAGEQCDDGNTVSGDGCGQSCWIEFCGDSVVSPGSGEECDDGNGISGDGCSSLCKNEGEPPSSSASSASSESSANSESNQTPSSQDETQSTTPAESPQNQTAPPPVSQAKAALVPQAAKAAKFLQSPDSSAYTSVLTKEQSAELLQILSKLENKKPLTPQEKIWAQELQDLLLSARAAERERYTDLLKEFIASPISSAVVQEKGLSQSQLVDVAVPIAIDELNRAIEIIQRGQLKQQILFDLSRLKRHDIDIEKSLPPDFLSSLEKGARPIDVFTVLKTIKEEAEQRATTDLPHSLEVIRTNVAILSAAAATLEREYGLRPGELTTLLDAIDATSRDVTAKDADRVVSAVDRLLALLKRKNILSVVDLLTQESSLHPAAHAARILREAGLPAPPQGDIRSLAVSMSENAPTRYKDAFEKGTVEDQRNALLQFLDDDERLLSVLKMLRSDGHREFDIRLEMLKEQIRQVGITNDPATTCDDSISDALSCVADTLSDLQDAARSKNILSNIIGHLQDYFGIGQ